MNFATPELPVAMLAAVTTVAVYRCESRLISMWDKVKTPMDA
jgi:hypothetical protein